MARRLPKWLTTRKDLRTLAVDAYVEVKLRQTQLHLGHLLNAFAQHKMTKYLLLMSQHNTLFT